MDTCDRFTRRSECQKASKLACIELNMHLLIHFN
jgi:hypothetical protein